MMPAVSRTPFLSGDEIVVPDLPPEVRVVHPPAPGFPLTDVREATLHALANPVDGLPLAQRVKKDDRVLVVFDSPAFPVPPMRADPRAPALAAILETLASCGLALGQVSLLCASGLTRRFRNTELAAAAGVSALASHHTRCHDAEEPGGFAELGTTSEGEPIELDTALTEADLVITLALAQGPLQGGYTTLIGGLASARTARALLSPRHLAEGPTHFDPYQGRMHLAMKRAGELVERKLPVFQVELAIDTRLLTRAFSSLLEAQEGLTAPARAWNLMPQPLRQRAARLMRSDYQTVSVHAGSVGAVHARTIQVLQETCTVPVEGRSDVVILGVPTAGPHTQGGSDNPVLAATFAFGYLLAWHQGGPLFRDGGAVILLNPLAPHFDRAMHAAHADFYEQVLPVTRDAMAMGELEEKFAAAPERLSAYRTQHAYHPLHPFHRWYRAAGTLARCGKVFAVGADPKVAERLGFSAVATLERALAEAKEMTGGDQATVSVLAIPPAFGVRIR